MSSGRLLLAISVGSVALAIILGAYHANKNVPTDQELIDQAVVHLMADSTLVDSATRGIVTSTRITPKALNGEDLAQTAVSADGSWHTCIDVQGVQRCADRLEPVIAHELFHVLQATRFGTPAEFIARVNAEKPAKDWAHRSFEIEAMAWEDKVRLELKSKNPEAYRTMPATRAATNLRSRALRG